MTWSVTHRSVGSVVHEILGHSQSVVEARPMERGVRFRVKLTECLHFTLFTEISNTDEILQ